MAMVSLAPPKASPFFTATIHHHLNSFQLRRPLTQSSYRRPTRLISASSPSPASPNEVYQPFRPPPSPLPTQYHSLGPADRLEILRDRIGLWHEYAPLIPSLSQDGLTPPSIEEATGISGVEQNRLVVAVRVRDSLVSSKLDPDALSYFDIGGAELLYELRLLNASQRAMAARRVAECRLDGKAAQELARAIKDFPRRKAEVGWECFSAASPGDCLAYTYFRLARESISVADRTAALEQAIEAAETEAARKRITEELEATRAGVKIDGAEDVAFRSKLPVIRLRYGEVAEASSVAMLPVCEVGDGKAGVEEAPGCQVRGAFGVVSAERGWRRWVVLPGWEPVMGAGEGRAVVAVAFGDARVLPWRMNKWQEEEAVLVVVDKARKDVVEENGYYLVGRVGGGGGGLAVEKGKRLLELGVKAAVGTVVLVVRPPRYEDDDPMQDDDWE